MPQNFLTCDREQAFLMPPSLLLGQRLLADPALARAEEVDHLAVGDRVQPAAKLADARALEPALLEDLGDRAQERRVGDVRGDLPRDPAHHAHVHDRPVAPGEDLKRARGVGRVAAGTGAQGVGEDFLVCEGIDVVVGERTEGWQGRISSFVAALRHDLTSGARVSPLADPSENMGACPTPTPATIRRFRRLALSRCRE